MKAKLSTGITMHFESAGEGEPLVLIAGTSIDSRAWHLQLPALTPRYRVLATTVAFPRFSTDVSILRWQRDRAHVPGRRI